MMLHEFGKARLLSVAGLAAVLAASIAVPARVAAQTSSSSAFKAEITRSIDDAEKKVEALAERFPQDKYDYRPGEGVRSSGEVFMHIAAANYAFATLLGTPRPEGTTSAALAKITEKAKVVETLKASFAHLKTAIENTADIDKPIKLFGRDTTMREAIIVAAAHCHEHLGQLIAYSRVNGIVPPWTEEAQARRRSGKS